MTVIPGVRWHDTALPPGDMLPSPGLPGSPFIQSAEMSAHSSAFFNPEIANAFFRSGEHRAVGRGSLPKAARRARTAKRARQIEAWGRGIWRIFHACKEAGTPKPILQYEPNDLWLEFRFSNEYLKSISKGESTEAQVTPEVLRMVEVLQGAMSRTELMSALGLKYEKHFREHYQQTAVRAGLIEMTIPDKPNSRLQKYRLTGKGQALLDSLKKNGHRA